MKQYENITLKILFFSTQDVLTESSSNDNVTNVPDFD